MSADKCPHCGAEPNGLGEWKTISSSSACWVRQFQCGTHECENPTDLCKERTSHAATKRELEEKRRDFDQAKTNAETNARLLNELTPRCLAAEARVAELEGLAIGNERREDDGVWVEVFIPIERLGGADCEGEESPTLGDAMPRKDP